MKLKKYTIKRFAQIRLSGHSHPVRGEEEEEEEEEFY